MRTTVAGLEPISHKKNYQTVALEMDINHKSFCMYMSVTTNKLILAWFIFRYTFQATNERLIHLVKPQCAELIILILQIVASHKILITSQGKETQFTGPVSESTVNIASLDLHTKRCTFTDSGQNSIFL